MTDNETGDMPMQIKKSRGECLRIVQPSADTHKICTDRQAFGACQICAYTCIFGQAVALSDPTRPAFRISYT
jgi:hypothetical protein